MVVYEVRNRPDAPTGQWCNRQYRVDYGVYYALGETLPAKEEWENAEKTENIYLLSKIYFNKGIYFYEKGNYEESYNYFKKALKINPSNIDIKINLELSLKKMNSDNKKNTKSNQDAKKNTPLGNEARRVLDYVKRREINKWASNRNLLKSDIKNDW